ncbi:MAG: hypothetical protein IKV10_00705 [Alphaproteobacteria bacterium]|nr:hypothetical protein [Alphaproteobacteria bacterium]
MARTDKNLVIGLTTFSHEFLKVSVAGLAHAAKNSVLVIYNDNPCRKLTHRDIRRLGFHGRTHIINTDENIGVLRARVAILDYVRENKIAASWIMFANDDDIVLNAVVPSVDKNIYAVVGNAVSVGGRLLDVLRVMINPNDYTVDGADTKSFAPHISMAGTLVRMDTVLDFGKFLSSVILEVMDIVSDIPFVAPTDLIMWNMLVEYMRILHSDMSPIYMNQTNYLMTKLNNSRYPSALQRDGIVSRATALVSAALRGNE